MQNDSTIGNGFGIEVRCSLKQCAYHLSRSGDGKVFCRHPQKQHHPCGELCPLYRLDWRQMSEGTADIQQSLRQRFGIPE
jgi:hypothetical protein